MEQIYFRKVEEVLQNFPSEWSRNYFTNKYNVKINYEEPISKNLSGSYDHDASIITIYSDEAFPHELFHMAFRDENKISKRIWKDLDIYFGNGMSFIKYQNGEKSFYNRGITEGMAEYLSRKCSSETGHKLEYFFVDLLISIYGEEILKYPLQNDPVGLLADERFFNIIDFSKKLDLLHFCQEEILLVINFKSTFEKILKTEKKEEVYHIMEMIDTNRKNYKTSIVSLFESIIEEYKNSQNPIIDKDTFIKKLEEIFNNHEYNIAFGFDDNDYSVRNEITKIINEFQKDKKLKLIKKSKK